MSRETMSLIKVTYVILNVIQSIYNFFLRFRAYDCYGDKGYLSGNGFEKCGRFGWSYSGVHFKMSQTLNNVFCGSESRNKSRRVKEKKEKKNHLTSIDPLIHKSSLSLINVKSTHQSNKTFPSKTP